MYFVFVCVCVEIILEIISQLAKAEYKRRQLERRERKEQVRGFVRLSPPHRPIVYSPTRTYII